jgi:triphosphatase
MISDVRSEGLRAELKRLSEPLGCARNHDVFLSKTLPAERARHPDEQGLLNLEKYLKAQRGEAYAAVQAVLQSEEWRRFLIDLIAWINAGTWLTVDDAALAQHRDQPAHDYAAGVLEKRRRQVKKRGRGLDDLSPNDRHQVRIAAKKLRYGAEFFSSLYVDKKQIKRHKKFVTALSDLQDALGELNDIATGHEIIDDISFEQVGSSSALFAAGVTAADIKARTEKLLTDAREAYGELINVRPFWRYGGDCQRP